MDKQVDQMASRQSDAAAMSDNELELALIIFSSESLQRKVVAHHQMMKNRSLQLNAEAGEREERARKRNRGYEPEEVMQELKDDHERLASIKSHSSQTLPFNPAGMSDADLRLLREQCEAEQMQRKAKAMRGPETSVEEQSHLGIASVSMRFFDHASDLGRGKSVATATVEFMPGRGTPCGEGDWVDIAFDNRFPLSSYSLAALLSQVLPLQKSSSEGGAIDHNGAHCVVIRFSIPNHANGLNF